MRVQREHYGCFEEEKELLRNKMNHVIILFHILKDMKVNIIVYTNYEFYKESTLIAEEAREDFG